MKSLLIYQEIGVLAFSPQSLTGVQNWAGSALRHQYHHHTHFWDFCDPKLARPFAGADGPEVFASPPPGTTLAQAMDRTRFLVFLGACKSAELQEAMQRPDTVCLVFEPDIDRLNAFLAAEKLREMAGRPVFFVGGDPDRLNVPLLSMLPEDICEKGYPLFFAQDGLPQALPDYVRRVEELVELFYYRNIIYSLDSQDSIRGLPLRPMVRNAVYDRYKHFYENLAPCLQGGQLSDLRAALTGQTAILAAAGPALQNQLEFIRLNKDRAVLIAVNSALKPLLNAGIEPDFVVINDTSVDSEPTLAGLPHLGKTRLVAHCLSTNGQSAFERTYFFGNFPGQPFFKRESLLLHGSVITTAFALAEYMGCATAVLAGVQLASADPLAMNYSKGSQHEAHASDASDLPLTNCWPQLYPVTAADGSLLFTTLNFFDAAQWFADRIRLAGLKVVNLTPSSILQGPGITHDPAPTLPLDPELAPKLASLNATDFGNRSSRVQDFIRQEMAGWKTKQLAARQAGDNLSSAAAFIAACDLDNTSFMLQRFADFDNWVFHAAFFNGGTEETRLNGARYFLQYTTKMCAALLKILLVQHARIEALSQRPA